MRTRLSDSLLAGTLAISVALPGLALAGEGHHIGQACHADIAALCPDADSQCDAKQCLREHVGQLSAGCSQAIEAMKAEHAAVRAACEADVGRLCPQADSPRDARKCLHENREQLSAGCSDALHALHEARHGDANG